MKYLKRVLIYDEHDSRKISSDVLMTSDLIIRLDLDNNTFHVVKNRYAENGYSANIESLIDYLRLLDTCAKSKLKPYAFFDGDKTWEKSGRQYGYWKWKAYGFKTSNYKNSVRYEYRTTNGEKRNVFVSHPSQREILRGIYRERQ